jgi:hypothetical protein
VSATGGWLLAISRDAELAQALTRVLIRNGGRGQLWAAESPEQARLRLADRNSLPSIIVIDEPFLRQELLTAVAEEFAWYAPLVLIAKPEREARLASLVAEGKADVVLRSDSFIPMVEALVERTLRWEREMERQIALPAANAIAAGAGGQREPGENGFPMEALRGIGAILDILERVLSERSQLPAGAAKRLERVADLAFDMKRGLRLLAGCAGGEDVAQAETANRG